MKLYEHSAHTLAAMVHGGEVSASEVLEAHITRIEALDPLLNCFTNTTFPRARAEAEAVDRKIAIGADPGPLAGVPIAVKNLFDVQGLSTRAGSKIFRNAPEATADAPVLARLIQAGAMLLGALNMDEFAYGFVTENAHDGATRNPHDISRVAGGSSGGSAAAIAAGFAAITLGSDTNGSIRLPAGLCGIFGLKPSYGRIERTGTFPFVDSLDHLGPFARSATDLALAYDIMKDCDICRPAPLLDPSRIAVLGGWFEQGADPEILAAVAAVARGLGAAARTTLPAAHIARAAAFCITAFEGGQFHKPNLIARPEDFDPATRPRLIAGALQPAETIYQAQRFRTWFRAEAEKLFERFDLLLAPASPCVAPLIGQATMIIGGEEVPVRPNLGLYTQPISFIGLPVVCVPVTGGGLLPRGVQIIAAPGRERLALAAATMLEREGVVAAPLAAL
ncbi:MAG: AtzE family amidohydrolase [Acidocella sp.]|nr:AtzE family amidohydrolase [Acidocella sp.]